jgi:cation/acetate symporter
MPAWFTKWKLQVLTFEDKNGDGKIQYYNDNSKDAAFLAAQGPKQAAELTIDKDIMVLLILKSQTYPIGLLL